MSYFDINASSTGALYSQLKFDQSIASLSDKNFFSLDDRTSTFLKRIVYNHFCTMKSFRRSRSIYLRATSSSLDDRDDDNSVNVLLIGDGQQAPPMRSCKTLLLESIHKLKCNNSSKGVALLSQSDVSIDPTVGNNLCDMHAPSIDPLTIYPSLNLNHGAVKHFVTKPYNKTRRCEDDASDDALTAPRRFLSPSKLHPKKNWNQTLVPDVVPQDHGGPVDTPLSDIPECVIIPHKHTDPFHDDYCGDDAHGTHSITGSSPFVANYYEDIPISLKHSAPDSIIEETERRVVAPDRCAIDQPENLTLDIEPSKMRDTMKVVDKHLASPMDSEQNGTREYILNSAQPRHIDLDFELEEYGSQYQRLDKDDRVPHVAIHNDNNNQQRRSEIPLYDSNASRDISFWSENVPSTQRTFYLASPTEETTKMSSLSKKLQTDQRQLSLQASDTSFATTKSGATQATSHSTSTGISRSSRKTQELIRRFERHHLQKTGHSVYDKGIIRLPT